MRVKVSYGMEIKDVPELGGDLGKKAIESLREAVQTLEKAVENIDEVENDYSMISSMLEKVRRKLTKSDLIITDLEAILDGLSNYYNGEQDVSERRPIMDPGGNTTEET